MAELLEEFGYDKSLLTNYDEKMKACLEAFSTHYLGLRFSEDNLPKIIYALNNLITYRSIEA